jgi:hypothetical protein
VAQAKTAGLMETKVEPGEPEEPQGPRDPREMLHYQGNSAAGLATFPQPFPDNQDAEQPEQQEEAEGHRPESFPVLQQAMSTMSWRTLRGRH